MPTLQCPCLDVHNFASRAEIYEGRHDNARCRLIDLKARSTVCCVSRTVIVVLSSSQCLRINHALDNQLRVHAAHTEGWV